MVDGELADGHPMLLDRNGHICADLWPLVQAVPPAEAAETELFLFDGHGRSLANGTVIRGAPNACKSIAAISGRSIGVIRSMPRASGAAPLPRGGSSEPMPSSIPLVSHLQHCARADSASIALSQGVKK